jgi:hypothetical protein
MQLYFNSAANCVLHRTDCNMLKVPVLTVRAYYKYCAVCSKYGYIIPPPLYNFLCSLERQL